LTNETQHSPGGPRACGECTLCCKLFILPELDKAAGVWCKHRVDGKGCAIHDRRPNSCRVFQCAWTLIPTLDENWRPDIAGFVMTTDDMRIYVDTDPDSPIAWRREPYYKQLKLWSRRDRLKFLTVIVRAPDRTIMVFPETDIDLGAPRPDAEIVSGYEPRGGRLVPYARYANGA
jgi:hypothetical protein